METFGMKNFVKISPNTSENYFGYFEVVCSHQ